MTSSTNAQLDLKNILRGNLIFCLDSTIFIIGWFAIDFRCILRALVHYLFAFVFCILESYKMSFSYIDIEIVIYFSNCFWVLLEDVCLLFVCFNFFQIHSCYVYTVLKRAV